MTAPARPRITSSLWIEPLSGEPGGYELRLVLGNELRVLRDADCRVLFRSAIVIAAAASGGAAPSASASPAAELPTPTPPPGSEPAPPTPPGATTPTAPALSAAPRDATPRPPAPAAARSPRVPPPRPATTARERQSARLARLRFARAAARADTKATRESEALAAASARSAPAEAGRAEPAEAAPPEGERPRPPANEVPNGAAVTGHRWGADVGIGASAGVLPDLGPMFELGARLEQSWWGVALSFRYWPQQSDGRGGRSVELSPLGGRVAALLRVAPAVHLLAGLELDRLVGEGGTGVSGRNKDVVWRFGPALGLNTIVFDIEEFRLEVGVAGRVSMLRPRFVVIGYGDLYRVPALGADAIIRGVWLFR